MTRTLSHTLSRAFGLCLLLFSSLAVAADIEKEILSKIEYLRTVRADDDGEKIKEHNEKMDSAWSLYDHNLKEAMPILRRELGAEMGRPTPNQLVLLDIGNFLSRQGGAENRAIAKQALYKIDPSSGIIALNTQDLFHFAYQLADEHEEAMLQAFDRLFLPIQGTAFVPQHAMTLDGTLMSVFLYGKYGPAAEAHLHGLLAGSANRTRIMEVLIWLGTPDSNGDIKAAMNAHRDYETFSRATAFFMRVGGRQGREIMLAVNPNDLDAQSKENYLKITGAIKEMSYQRMEREFAAMSGYQPVNDKELKQRLDKMYEKYGKDDDLHPLAILKSGLPKSYLIEQLG